MDFPECGATLEGHITDEDDTVCVRCEAEQCPDCGRWFSDLSAFEDHVSKEE